jgi:hypothetical protein
MIKLIGLVTAFLLLAAINTAPLRAIVSVPAYNIIKPNKNIIKITDKLYISDYYESIKYDDLKNLGIKQILSVGVELPDHKTDEFKLKHIKIDDHPDVNIMKHFENAYLFIDQGVTLVHCYAGISRSASIIISYLMKKYNLSYEKAYNYVKNKRPIINPNRGFKKQLIQYENYLKSNI